MEKEMGTTCYRHNRSKENAMDAEQDEFEMQGDKYIDGIQAKEAELQKKIKDILKKK